MGATSNKTIVWFRRDLRIDDNPALAAAARDGSVCPLFIWCPKEEGQFYPGRVLRWWLKQSLVHLDHSLRSLGAPLVLIKAESTLDALLQCIGAISATKIVYNHLYDPVSLLRYVITKSNKSWWSRGYVCKASMGICFMNLGKFMMRRDMLLQLLMRIGPSAYPCRLNLFHIFLHGVWLHQQLNIILLESSCITELIRLPTEWIHHPWKAPLTVLATAGVALGFNYPKPIVDLDLARERLIDAVSMMRESEAAARARQANGEQEEIMDNLDETETLGIPTVYLKGKACCTTNSSNDQRVPSFHNSKNVSHEKKRPQCWEDNKQFRDTDKLHNYKCEPGASQTEEDLCSTAESSSTKKWNTSTNQFTVPPLHSSSGGESLYKCEASDIKRPWQEQTVMDQLSGKEGNPNELLTSLTLGI